MVKIVKAEPADLPEILALQKTAYISEARLLNDFSIPPLQQNMEQLKEEYTKGIVIKAINDLTGEIVGSVRGYTENRTLYIGKLMVHPDHQHRGIGKLLLRHMENCFPGYRYELFTSNKSLKNITFYEKEGYTQFKTTHVCENMDFVYLEKTYAKSDMEEKIRRLVHHYYWDLDVNCARTALYCFGELFHQKIDKQTIDAAIGLHGAGGFRAQCGLVEGSLMFIGIVSAEQGKSDAEISDICYEFADKFNEKFASLKCYDLRPNGFSPSDPPHLCENLTRNAIAFTCDFIQSIK